MSKSTLAFLLLVVCFALVADTDAWFKDTWNEFKDNVKDKYEAAKKKLQEFGAKVKETFGKRQADYDALLSALGQVCPGIIGDIDVIILSVLEDALQESDSDGDGKLSPDELEAFAAMAAVQEFCTNTT